jgi:exonuclease 1
MLVFGAKVCLYKLSNEYHLKEVNLCDIYSSEELEIKGWSHKKFIYACILSGCDYLASPKGIALKTAVGLLNKH